MSHPDALSVWTVFERPRDYPDGFIARRFEARHNVVRATADTVTGPDLDSVRAQLPPGLYRLERCADDDRNIVESWI